VDHLLGLIEAEGEKREWVDEVVALSKRYKFVTPYTAFLAAPRSLLRPRRIQPGDPVLRVECDPGIVSALALLPFGLRLPLVKRPGTSTWEGRFLVPEGLPDGRYEARVLLRDRSGARIHETKSFVLDGRAPEVLPGRWHRPGPARPCAWRCAPTRRGTPLGGQSRRGPLRWTPLEAFQGTLQSPAGCAGSR
jgi:Ca-activated chloride channel family protein